MRLQRRGKRNRPTYRVVVAERTAPVKGRFVADLGPYNPHTDEFAVDADTARDWLAKGVQPSPTVHNLLITHGILDGEKVTSWRAKPKEGEAAEGDHSEEAGGAASSEQTEESAEGTESEEQENASESADEANDEAAEAESTDNANEAEEKADTGDAEAESEQEREETPEDPEDSEKAEDEDNKEA